jgi:hypothetical protein
MNSDAQILDRWKFGLPGDYRAALRCGLLNPQKGGFRSSLLRWLTPSQILAVEWPIPRLSSFIPFAIETSTSALCWNVGSDPGWVYYSPVDSENAVGFAGTFSAATFRVFIEDLCGNIMSWHYKMDSDQIARYLQGCVERCAVIWKPEWMEAARGLLQKPREVSEDGTVAFITERAAKAVVKKYVDFPMMNIPLYQYVG